MAPHAIEIRILDTLAAIPPPEWDALTGDHPLLSHAFLHSLHETGCASAETGWLPQYPTLWQDGRLLGAMPLYVKNHSYGEYVFDWAWAEAYQRHGLHYYPKLVAAIPFTPATGGRLLAHGPEHRRILLDAAGALVGEYGASSLHILFPEREEAHEIADAGLMLRHGLQFVWHNDGYADFAAFLGSMSHDKRKRIKQERRKLTEAGVHYRLLDGRTATHDDWRFFFRCYTRTYREHRSTPYLTLEFFLRLAERMPDNLMLVVGKHGERTICAALNVHNERTLYGRYWGTLEYVPGLHFETCYYQALEFCIARGLQRFEGGAQGHHKLARGFLPHTTYSAHSLVDTRFARAVDDYLEREKLDVAHTLDELGESSPFKRDHGGS